MNHALNTVEPITTLTVDGQTFAVTELSDDVKRLVGIINGWRQKEAAAREDLLIIQAAVRDIQRELTVIVQRETKPAEVPAEVPATEPANEGDDA